MKTENYNGRSMIEMLGVLAIIGVLSVGGIAGYSKAMYKLELNKLINQISHIAMNIQTVYMAQGNLDGLPLWQNARMLANMGIIEEDMIGSTQWDNVILLPFGGSMWLGGLECDWGYDSDDICNNSKVRNSYAMQMYNLPERVVKDLMTYDWSIINGFHGFDTYDEDFDDYNIPCIVDSNLPCRYYEKYVGTGVSEYDEDYGVFIYHYPDTNGRIQNPAPISITSQYKQMNSNWIRTQFKLVFVY